MAFLNKDNIFLGITTSGKSKNIIKALEYCNKKKIPTIIFTGNDGGNVKSLTKFCVIAPGDSTSTIQEVHILLAHTLCEYVEQELMNLRMRK